MNPKLEILLTYFVSIFAFIAALKALNSNLSKFNIALLIVTFLVWFISAIIKSYKYKKNKKIY